MEDKDQLDELIQGDLALARITEDLVNLLIDKGVISFSDLPEDAQKKLAARHDRRRNELDYVANLFIGSDDDPAN